MISREPGASYIYCDVMSIGTVYFLQQDWLPKAVSNIPNPSDRRVSGQGSGQPNKG